MATFESAHYALQKPTRTNISRKAPPNVSSGSVEFAVIPYTLLGTEAATDVLLLCELPPEAIVLPQLSNVTCSADPGTALVLDIGTSADVDNFADGITLSSGGQVAFTSGTIPAGLVPTQLAADSSETNTTAQALFMTATSLTAGVILYFTIAYKRGR